MGPLPGPCREGDESNMTLSSEFTSPEICKFTFAIEYDKNSSGHAFKEDRNKSACGGRCQGGLQRKSVPWILVPPGDWKPQVESWSLHLSMQRASRGEYLEGQWGLKMNGSASPVKLGLYPNRLSGNHIRLVSLLSSSLSYYTIVLKFGGCDGQKKIIDVGKE